MSVDSIVHATAKSKEFFTMLWKSKNMDSYLDLSSKQNLSHNEQQDSSSGNYYQHLDTYTARE